MKRILLANQSRVTLELIRVYLIVKDVQILDARDGVEALNIARRERPDLILCDLNLPGLDGPGLCRELQANPALRDIPVIMIIGNRDPESLHRCREAGVRAILTRPIRPRQLHEAVQCHSGIDLGSIYSPAMTPAANPAPVTPPSAPGFSAASPAAIPKRWWTSRSKAS
jgi:two-component system cell cycle response regulator